MTNGFWDEVENVTRDILQCATALIPNREVAGYLFGIGLIATDHIFRLFGRERM